MNIDEQEPAAAEPTAEENRAIPHSNMTAEAPAPAAIVEEIVEPEAKPEPQPVAVEAPVEAPKPKPAVKPAPARHVVTHAAKDPVYLSACVYMNKLNKKSLTVHHLQRRLVELGYNDAVGDKDGYYGELTHKAVASFQKDNRIEATGLMNEKTMKAIFNDDPNVEVFTN